MDNLHSRIDCQSTNADTEFNSFDCGNVRADDRVILQQGLMHWSDSSSSNFLGFDL